MNDAVARALFVVKYKVLLYHLFAQSEGDIDRLNFIQEEDIVWCSGRDDGWTIFGQCRDPTIKEDKNNTFAFCHSYL